MSDKRADNLEFIIKDKTIPESEARDILLDRGKTATWIDRQFNTIRRETLGWQPHIAMMCAVVALISGAITAPLIMAQRQANQAAAKAIYYRANTGANIAVPPVKDNNEATMFLMITLLSTLGIFGHGFWFKRLGRFKREAVEAELRSAISTTR